MSIYNLAIMSFIFYSCTAVSSLMIWSVLSTLTTELIEYKENK